MLQIAIHGYNVLAPRMVESRREPCRLPEVPTQLHNRHATVHRRDLAQHGEGVVGGAVVNENDFEALTVGFHDHLQAVIEVGDVLFFVM